MELEKHTFQFLNDHTIIARVYSLENEFLYCIGTKTSSWLDENSFELLGYGKTYEECLLMAFNNLIDCCRRGTDYDSLLDGETKDFIDKIINRTPSIAEINLKEDLHDGYCTVLSIEGDRCLFSVE